MVQKILLTLEIDDSALDAAQAKADKLIATLREAKALADALAKEKPPDTAGSSEATT